eukprot:704667-Pleurochrysis_carterae.AAC.1
MSSSLIKFSKHVGKKANGNMSRCGLNTVGDTSTVHRYGRGATSVLRVSAVRALRLCIRDRMN